MGQARAGHEEHRQRGQRDDGRRAEVRLRNDEQHDRGDDHQEGDRPAPEAADAPALLGEPVREVDDECDLADLRGVDGRQRPHLQEPRRPADHAVEAGREHEHEQDERHDVRRNRDQAQVAVVDARHDEHGDEAERRPEDLRPDDGERVVVRPEVGLDRRRRVDHQHADRGQSDDRDEDRVIGLVAVALERIGLRRGAAGHGRAGDASDDRGHQDPPRPRTRRLATAALNARPRTS